MREVNLITDGRWPYVSKIIDVVAVQIAAHIHHKETVGCIIQLASCQLQQQF